MPFDIGAAKNALRTAREAWHKAIDESVDNWTPAAHHKECRTIDKLNSAIRDLQVFLPEYDPKANKEWYASDP